MKKFFIVLGILIATLVVFSAIDLYSGYFGVFYTKTVGKAQQNAERKVFKESQPYNDGMAQQLSKLKMEYNTSKDETEKTAIKYRVVHEFADFNADNLQDEGLKTWLNLMRN